MANEKVVNENPIKTAPTVKEAASAVLYAKALVEALKR